MSARASKSEEKSNSGGKKGKTPKKSLAEVRKEKTEKVLSKKNVVKPKRPISAFFFFTIDNRKKLKEKNPNITIKEIAV